jgi:hypothetical protein
VSYRLGLPRKTSDGCPLEWVRTSVVRRHADPFVGCWDDIGHPVSLDEVDDCLARGAEFLHAPFYPPTYGAVARGERRFEHIQKIAWFARHGFQEPLEVDVGVPFLGCHVRHKVIDGNHRLASGIYRLERLGEDPLLPLSVGGDVEYARSLGLWTSRRGLPRKRK